MKKKKRYCYACGPTLGGKMYSTRLYRNEINDLPDGPNIVLLMHTPAAHT